jgi:hypothetical protein
MKERGHFQHFCYRKKLKVQEIIWKTVFFTGFLYYKLTFFGFILQGLRDVYSDSFDFSDKFH